MKGPNKQHKPKMIRQSIACSVLMYIDAVIIFRFVYIFDLKNPAAFRDDFWCLFVSLWIHSTGLIFAATLNILAHFQNLPNILCTGQITEIKVFGKEAIFISIFNVILHFSINSRISLERRTLN